MSKKATRNAAPPMPQDGGHYTRDPVSGALTLVSATTRRPMNKEEQREAEAKARAKPTSTDSAPASGSTDASASTATTED